MKLFESVRLVGQPIKYREIWLIGVNIGLFEFSFNKVVLKTRNEANTWKHRFGQAREHVEDRVFDADEDEVISK